MNERDRRALRVVGDQAHRLQQLIDEMLNISRIEIGLFNVERHRMDLAALVRRVVAEIEGTLQHHVITLDIEVEPAPIEGDERRLEQVLQNLLGNAIKYSPNGGDLSVRLGQSAGYANLAIADNGMGIPERELGQLFQRFYRAGNIDSAQISGFGLGLYLVKEIVSRHDGSVDVASREGQGSTFTVRLPLVPADSA
jgi:signal transduction histidine kinase